jgi:hypothetical protein
VRVKIAISEMDNKRRMSLRTILPSGLLNQREVFELLSNSCCRSFDNKYGPTHKVFSGDYRGSYKPLTKGNSGRSRLRRSAEVKMGDDWLRLSPVIAGMIQRIRPLLLQSLNFRHMQGSIRLLRHNADMLAFMTL